MRVIKVSGKRVDQERQGQQLSLHAPQKETIPEHLPEDTGRIAAAVQNRSSSRKSAYVHRLDPGDSASLDS